MTTGQTSETTFTLPSDREIVMSRVFNAPRELVFKAATEPQHVARWWGPRDLSTTLCEGDLRPGGAWRTVHRDAQGNEFPFKGVYREIVPPARIVQTQIFDVEPYRDREMVVTVTFDDLGDGRTRLTSTSVFPSVEDRDGMLASGMERGARESFERLAELIDTLDREIQ
jgi:uncharacterized protein YndB with AHSA1/START domain